MASTTNAEFADQLRTHLGLEISPVALSLVDSPPDGIPSLGAEVPSACTFWRRAEQQVFYASADEHMGCAIGGMVMGFELPETKQQELMGLVQQMVSLNYVRMDEVPHIPKFERASAGTVYGRLDRFPLDPELVLIWATPTQAMLLQEAVGAVLWADEPKGAYFGRPACGVLPTAVARGTATVSLGCMGMRTYTEIAPDRLLVAIPGPSLASLAADLERTAAANEQMRAFYSTQKARF